MIFRIIPRTEWGAKHRNGFGSRAVGNLDKWLHHSVTIAPDLIPPFDDDFQAIRNLEAIGQSRFGGGMSYTTLFTPAGLIFEGLGIDRVGSHTANRNTGSAGLCLVGNYDNSAPTSLQEAAIAWYLNHGVVKGWWKSNELTGGHRDTFATACPGGKAYSRIGSINALADSRDYEQENGMSAAEVWAHELVNPETSESAQAGDFLRWTSAERQQKLIWEEYLRKNEGQQDVNMGDVMIALDTHLNHVKNVQHAETIARLDKVLTRLDELEAKVDALPDA